LADLYAVSGVTDVVVVPAIAGVPDVDNVPAVDEVPVVDNFPAVSTFCCCWRSYQIIRPQQSNW
jgi:hypothetical protein